MHFKYLKKNFPTGVQAVLNYPLICQTMLYIELKVTFCTLWCILVFLFSIQKCSQGSTASYKQHFIELIYDGVDYDDCLRFEGIWKIKSKNNFNHKFLNTKSKIPPEPLNYNFFFQILNRSLQTLQLFYYGRRFIFV